MDPIRFAIENRVKVAVGVILVLLFGLIALRVIPIQLTPDTDPTIITVTTNWTGRSPEEVEKEIIEEQEDVLKNVRNLVKMTATAVRGEGTIELEFVVGTDLQSARVEVSDALREVPEYPAEVDEPVLTTGEAGAGSPIAWLLLTSQTPGFDVQSLGDPAEERVKPMLERVPGVSEVRVYGGREREVHVDFDPRKLAQRQVTLDALIGALRGENVNVSAGEQQEGRYSVRVRTTGEYEDLEQIRRTVIAYDTSGGGGGGGGPVRVSDVAEVSVGYQKRRSFVRSRGELALALPVYKESGANVISVMEGVNAQVDRINAEVLPSIAAQLQRDRSLDEPPAFHLQRVYDETGYIYDALELVQGNLVVGGVLATLALLVFLELGRRPVLVFVVTPALVVLMLASQFLPPGIWQVGAYALLGIAMLVTLWLARPTLIIALAIPISVIGTFVVMAGAGRNINVISLAGLAFAVGMVVDNGIVVLENIDRHLGMNKKPMQAAYDGAKEVWGAVLASTLTTLAVFLPILTIQEEAGQLFRDIALAIAAAVALSLVVSITVVPSAAARLLRPGDGGQVLGDQNLGGIAGIFRGAGSKFSQTIHWLTTPTSGGVAARWAVIGLFTVVSVVGSYLLMPPTDYLPRGNQNLVFGIVLTPPGYDISQDESIAQRVESVIRPYWQAESYDDLQGVQPPIHPFTGQPVENLPPVENYFFVSFNGGVFNGATSGDKNNIAPLEGLLTSAATNTWGMGFAQQSSLFGRGASGSRQIDVEITGNDLDEVRNAGTMLMQTLAGMYGFANVLPSPLNFDKNARELQFKIDRVKAAEMGIDVQALGTGVAAMVDGVVVGDYRLNGEAIDLLIRRGSAASAAVPASRQSSVVSRQVSHSVPATLVSDVPPVPPDDRRLTTDDFTSTDDSTSGGGGDLESLAQIPVAFRAGDGNAGIVPLSAIATAQRTLAPQQILRIEERRAVKLEVTPPDEMPLEAATTQINELIAQMRQQGAIKPTTDIALAGSASKLAEVREAMLGSWHGWSIDSLYALGTSRMFLALLVTYLLMAALFESFLYPLVILFSVPLATVGGFLGLAIMHAFVPSQQLDTLTMLGFVILIGVVVNNAILLVHQSLNFMRGLDTSGGEPMPPRQAIAESVRTRMRPIFMTTCTSVAGMLPLVLAPGSGSELYRGLGSVVVGGLIVSTLFTLVVVPLLLSLVLGLRKQVMGQA